MRGRPVGGLLVGWLGAGMGGRYGRGVLVGWKAYC